MGSFIDITGKKFNRWHVIHRAFPSIPGTHYFCRCDCGTERIVEGKHLRYGTSKSCGCLNVEITKANGKGNKYGVIHGLHLHPLYSIRRAFISRCECKGNKFYKNYGGRGITVCDEWRKSPKAFYEWAIANGWVKGLSLDRIDNNGNYEPSNCRWITISENSRRPKSRLKRGVTT